jgi:hypothetical protein
VNGIQVSFADSQTNSLINRVLSANGLSNVIPTSSRKVERWDTWTNAKVVIGKSKQICFLYARLGQSLWHYRLSLNPLWLDPLWLDPLWLQ